MPNGNAYIPTADLACFPFITKNFNHQVRIAIDYFWLVFEIFSTVYHPQHFYNSLYFI